MPDAIVIGAGPNGLAAAVALARAGRETLVVEEAASPGGAVRSAALTLPGFVHDVHSAVHPVAVASPAFAAIGLERHGLRWSEPELPLAHPLENGVALALHRDVGATARSLETVEPGSGAAYERAFAPLVDAWPALRPVLFGRFPPAVASVGALRALGGRGSVEAVWLLASSVERLERSQGSAAAALVGGSALHSDVPLRAPGSAAVGVVLGLLGHVVGWPSPVGGAGRLTDALVAALVEAGGAVRTGSRADRIEVVGGRVAAVHLDGERLACREVVADVSPGELVRLAGGALRRSYREALGGFRQVDWALSGPVPWIAEACRHAGTVHVGGRLPELLDGSRALRAGRLPPAPFLLCGQQSIADRSRAPDGCHTLWAYGHVPRSADWSAGGEAHADRIEERIESFAPGFRALVLGRAIQTPWDLERADRNLVGGDVGGGSMRPLQLIRRPTIRPYRTPVAGLVLGSASTPPGGGVHGVCGWNAASVLIRARRRRAQPLVG
jgi:phytoene dehydrogenase-like protein